MMVIIKTIVMENDDGVKNEKKVTCDQDCAHDDMMLIRMMMIGMMVKMIMIKMMTMLMTNMMMIIMRMLIMIATTMM